MVRFHKSSSGGQIVVPKRFLDVPASCTEVSGESCKKIEGSDMFPSRFGKGSGEDLSFRAPSQQNSEDSPSNERTDSSPIKSC